MDLSKAHAGPGSQIAGNFSEVLEALIRITQNNNEQKKMSFETQKKAATLQFEETIKSFNSDAEATRNNAIGSLVGATVSGVATGGAHGLNAVQSRNISGLSDRMENIDTFRNKMAVKTPTNTEILQGPKTENQTTLGEDFLHSDTKEALRIFEKEGFAEKTDDLVTGVQGDKARAGKKADHLYDHVRTERDRLRHEHSQRLASFQNISQITNGVSTSFGNMYAASDKEAQGRHEAEKTQMGILLGFVKSIQDNTTQAVAYAQQQRGELLAAERAVFQANYARG